ncbi:MAG: PspC domain-containing protein [bacterium]|nr:PspC domain-containing protein [bacterium]
MKRLYRSRKSRVFAGICGGLGEHFDIDPVLVRVIAVVLTLFTGLPLLGYIVAIFVVPEEPLLQSAQGAQAAPSQPADTSQAAGTAGASQPPPATVAPVKQGPDMGEHVRILGILYIVLSALGLVAAFIAFVAITGGGLISGDDTAITVTSIVGISVAGILLLFSAPGIIGGMGLLKRQSWARILVLVLGILNLLNVPFGTALGIYSIWTLTNKETEKLFSGNS